MPYDLTTKTVSCANMQSSSSASSDTTSSDSSSESSSSEDKARTYKHRISDIRSSPYALFDIRNSLSVRLRNVELAEQVLEKIPILRLCDRRNVCSYNLYAPFHERFG